MDWSWMGQPKHSKEYLNGVDEFLRFAYQSLDNDVSIRCPCLKCACSYKWKRDTIREHLYFNGVIKDKKFWEFHGSGSTSSKPSVVSNSSGYPLKDIGMQDMLHDVLGMQNEEVAESTCGEDTNKGCNEFYNLIEDMEKPLYPGCKNFNKLSFVIRLFNIKCMGRMSNKAFDMLLKLLKEALPDGEVLPSSFYELKKLISNLGYNYCRIDACPNDCILYWKDYEMYEECPQCGESRWKSRIEGDDMEKKVAKKVLRHFPLIPRLQRLYMCSKVAENMRWHEDERQKDGILRHPADSACWKCLDAIENFGAEARNVRLGLASDGFNPFGTMAISYSTWPVLLVPYNLPPWHCMKAPNIFLSLLIPGPYGPGNNIDVYLQPLIEELQILWHGIDAYDASKKEMFCMRAALLWTINDFPAYAYLSGWSTKGRLACPTCNKDTCSEWLQASGKHCYTGHRRWLKRDHKFRSLRRRFNGKEEWRDKPTLLCGIDVLSQLHGLSFTLGRVKKLSAKSIKRIGRPMKRRKRKRNGTSSMQKAKESVNIEEEKYLSWKKRSIFFELPYWKKLLLRHNLDVMHIEKNVCDSIIGTLLDINGKSKDGLKARQDLQSLGIRPSLHPQELDSKKMLLPPAIFTLSKIEKEQICTILKHVKVPDGYASNISRHVNIGDRKKIWGLKSYDCHVLIQQLLPVAIRGITQKEVRSTIIDLCNFFSQLCSKISSANDFYYLREQITMILCRLEMAFPPSFFDIMVHLLIHLPDEARVAGPVQYRWMYPIERFLVRLKANVRNKAHPEGSIAEGYLAEETVTFASRYLDDDVQTWLNRPIRNEDDGGFRTEKGWEIFAQSARPLGVGVNYNIGNDELNQAHRYVLFNCEAVTPYISAHLDFIRKRQPRSSQMEIERFHTLEFSHWFKAEVNILQEMNKEVLSTKLRWLKDRPLNVVKKFDACLVNGFRFHIQKVEQRRATQNSGVVMTAKTSSFSSSKDKSPIHGDVTYYGILDEIVEFNYYAEMKILLFKCDWVDPQRGVKEEECFTLVNFKHKLRTSEPYVLASQVEQVWYVEDPKYDGFHVVRKTRPRNYFDMHCEESIENDGNESSPIVVGDNLDNIFDDDINVVWERHDIEGMEVPL